MENGQNPLNAVAERRRGQQRMRPMNMEVGHGRTQADFRRFARQ